MTTQSRFYISIGFAIAILGSTQLYQGENKHTLSADLPEVSDIKKTQDPEALPKVAKVPPEKKVPPTSLDQLELKIQSMEVKNRQFTKKLKVLGFPKILNSKNLDEERRQIIHELVRKRENLRTQRLQMKLKKYALRGRAL